MSRHIENCQPTTLKYHYETLSHFFRFLHRQGHNSTLNELQRYHIELYLLSLKERNLSPAYIRTTYRSLSAFFNWCVAEQFIPRSPLATMKPPKIPKLRKPFLSEAERDKL